MNILVFGGNSALHKVWVRDVATALKDGTNKVAYLDYKHWETGEKIDIDTEVNAASELASSLGEYIIVAKSVGTIITAKGVLEGKLAPAGCLLLGTPLSVTGETYPDFDSAVNALPRTIFLQNSHDPFASAQELEEFLEYNLPDDCRVETVPGETHDYEDYILIKKLAAELQ